MGIGEAMDAIDEQNEQPKKRGRKPRVPQNGAPPTMVAKKRGRPRKAAPVIGTTWDLILTKGKRGRLTLPQNLSKDDVDAVQLQLKPIFELASVQAGIEADEG